MTGTPDEEDAGGKVRLIEQGAFSAPDVALMAHPWNMGVVQIPGFLALDTFVLNCFPQNTYMLFVGGMDDHALLAQFPHTAVSAPLQSRRCQRFRSLRFLSRVVFRWVRILSQWCFGYRHKNFRKLACTQSTLSDCLPTHTRQVKNENNHKPWLPSKILAPDCLMRACVGLFLVGTTDEGLTVVLRQNLGVTEMAFV